LKTLWSNREVTVNSYLRNFKKCDIKALDEVHWSWRRYEK